MPPHICLTQCIMPACCVSLAARKAFASTPHIVTNQFPKPLPSVAHESTHWLMSLCAFTRRCLVQVFLFTCGVCDTRLRSGKRSCRVRYNARNNGSHTRVLKTSIGTGRQTNKLK